MTNKITYFAIFLILSFLVASQVLAESVFNPNFIISDAEMRNYNSWTRDNVQQFLDAKGSYLRLHQ